MPNLVQQIVKDTKTKLNTDADLPLLLSSQKYEEYGENFVNMLDGVFSFVLFDTRNKTYMAARDAVGVNPLYIGWGSDGEHISTDKAAPFHEFFAR